MGEREFTTARLFSGLWALYILIHQLKQIPWGPHYSVALMVLAVVMSGLAFAVLCRPGHTGLFLALIAVQLAGVIAELPVMSNVWLFTGFLDVGILGAAVVATRSRAGRCGLEDIYAISAPLLRCSLVAIYVFAVVAKFNSDFLDPEVSCAAYLYRVMASTEAYLPSSALMERAAVPLSLVAETSLPLLFVFRRTRNYAIVAGMLFHTLLAASPLVNVFDFNALLFTLYVAMAPENFPKRLIQHPVSRFAIWVTEQRVVVFGLLVMLSLLVVTLSLSTGDLVPLKVYRSYLWLLLGLGMTVTSAVVLFSPSGEFAPLASPFRLRSAWLVPGLLLIIVNGASPYLGLKTGVAYTMYSNLRTEDGFENHLFIPRALRVFSFQDAPVQILESTAPELQRVSDRNEALVFFDFQQRAYRNGEASVRYKRRETVIDVARISDDSTLGRPPDLLLSRLLYFRPVETGERTCQW